MEAWAFDYHGYLSSPLSFTEKNISKGFKVKYLDGRIPPELNPLSTGRPTPYPYVTISDNMTFSVGDLLTVTDGNQSRIFVAVNDATLYPNENILDRPEDFVRIDSPDNATIDITTDPIQLVANAIQDLSALTAMQIEEDSLSKYALFILSMKMNLMASRHIASIRQKKGVSYYVKACFYQQKGTSSTLTVIVDDEFGKVLSEDIHFSDLHLVKRDMTEMENRILKKRFWQNQYDSEALRKMIIGEKSFRDCIMNISIKDLDTIFQVIGEIYNRLCNITYDDLEPEKRTGYSIGMASSILDFVKGDISLEPIEQLELINVIPKGVFWAFLYMFVYRYYGDFATQLTTNTQYFLACELQKRLIQRLEENGFNEIRRWEFV